MIPDGQWLVRGRWPLIVRLALQADELQRAGGPPAFPTFKQSFIDRHIRCRAAIYEDGINRLDPKSVLEPFGGLGLTSSIIRGELKPAKHHVWEWYPALADHLDRNGFDSQRVNSFPKMYQQRRLEYDLIDADFGHWTIHTWRIEPAVRAFTDKLFTHGASSIVTTDESNARLHLHSDRYGAVLGGVVITPHDYVNLLSALFYELYGYSVQHAVGTHGAISMLWQKRPHQSIAGIASPAEGKGLVLAS